LAPWQNRHGRRASQLDSEQADRGRRRSPLTNAVVPYGYTLCVWATSVSLLHRYGGFPDALKALAFVSAAMTGFGVVALLRPRPAAWLTRVPRPLSHAAAVLLGCSLAWVSSRWLGSAAWAVAPYASTTSYFTVVSLIGMRSDWPTL
jgi:hypothetical protein